MQPYLAVSADLESTDIGANGSYGRRMSADDKKKKVMQRR